MRSIGNQNNNKNIVFDNDEAMNALIPRSKNDVFKSVNVLSGNNTPQKSFGTPLQYKSAPSLNSLEKSNSCPPEHNNYDYFNNNNKYNYNHKMDLDIEPFPLQFETKCSINSTLESINPQLNFPSRISQNFDGDMIVFVESKITKSSNIDDFPSSPPMIYNKYSSCTIKKYGANDVLQKLHNLLNCYTNEIHFEVDVKRYTIEGIVIIRHYVIYWGITIWEQSENSAINSIVEFQKRGGDSTGFQNFWYDMLNKIDEQFGAENVGDAQRCCDFTSLFVRTYDFCEPMKFDKEQLNKLQEQLEEDYQEIAIEALRLLCSCLENDAAFRTLVSKHEGLMQTLTKTVLNHVDSSHVRGALVVLQFIVPTENCVKELIGRYQILNRVMCLLQHRQTFVRKHAVRLLSLLSQKEWHLSNIQCSQVQAQLKKLQNEWNIFKPNNFNLYNTNNNDLDNDKEFVSWKMFDNIESRIRSSLSSSSLYFSNDKKF